MKTIWEKIFSGICDNVSGGNVIKYVDINLITGIYLEFIIIYISVLRVNWLTPCQERRRAVFWAHYCSSYTPRSFFLFWRIS